MPSNHQESNAGDGGHNGNGLLANPSMPPVRVPEFDEDKVGADRHQKQANKSHPYDAKVQNVAN